jgi:hypothetical protein
MLIVGYNLYNKIKMLENLKKNGSFIERKKMYV